MCGIAGALVYDPEVADLTRFREAVDASNARGRDSFGIVRWSRSTGWTEYRCLTTPAPNWFSCFPDLRHDEPAFFLHTSRAEPTTEWRHTKTSGDVPPFRNAIVAVAHNGVISNDKELADRFSIVPPSPIDTAMVPDLVCAVGVWQAIGMLVGGCALAIIHADCERLYLCRNFMPLSVVWEPGVVSFASEAAFFRHAGEPFTPFQLWELPAYSCIELGEAGFLYPIPWGQEPGTDPSLSYRRYPRLVWR